MAAGSNPYNIDFTLVLFNVWFAFVILFRESFDSPHPQGSWSLDWLVIRISIAMVPWFRGPRSFPAPIAIDLPTLLFAYPQIVNSCYGQFTFLPFFRHSPRVETLCLSRKKPHRSIAFGVQAKLVPCTAYFHGLQTLWGLWIFRSNRFWVGHFVTPRRGGCMVVPPFLGTISTPKKMSFLIQ